MYKSAVHSMLTNARNDGLQVKITHLRRAIDPNGNEFYDVKSRMAKKQALPNGGVTQVTLVTDNQEEFSGISRCSVEDNFCRHVGLFYALRRAFHAIKHNVDNEIFNHDDDPASFLEEIKNVDLAPVE